MKIELLAPAKINLGLEVLGCRDDGYHEVVTILQTIDLWDRVILEEADSLTVEPTGQEASGLPPEPQQNLAYRAAQALQAETGRKGGARIILDKEILVAAGLGGGSSDAAAVLRGLNQLWHLDLAGADLARIAAPLGSDVPFFLIGGTALCTGRGEAVEPLPDLQPRDIIVFVPVRQNQDAEKTRRMFESLVLDDFGDGAATRAAAASIRAGAGLPSDLLPNAFERPLADLAPQATKAMQMCRDAGFDVRLSGSGPAFYTFGGLEAVSPDFAKSLLGVVISIWGCRNLPRAGALQTTVT